MPATGASAYSENMHVVYARQPFPDTWGASIFLAGPTPREAGVASWRPAALELLRASGFEGVVFSPEDPTGAYQLEYLDQVSWERDALSTADVILFWVPRDLETLPAFTTNVELGHWVSSGKVVLGFPPGSPKNRYLGWLAKEHGAPVFDSLDATIGAALERTEPAAERSGGERGVPLALWRTASFQSWYRSLRAAGNRLDAARMLWSYTPRRMSAPFAWVLAVEVWVAAEARSKTNEWVLARRDLSSILLHGPVGADPRDTEVLLVREYRAPARTSDGFVHELPGGSAPDDGAPALSTAVEEVEEETGLALAPDRLRAVGARQLAGTWSSHVASLFVAELRPDELSRARQMADDGTPHGVGSERTVLEVTTPRAMLEDERVDWSTLGMVLAALSSPATT